MFILNCIGAPDHSSLESFKMADTGNKQVSSGIRVITVTSVFGQCVCVCAVTGGVKMIVPTCWLVWWTGNVKGRIEMLCLFHKVQKT
jgi:hypothetical protein